MSTLKLTQVVGAPVSVGVWVSVRDCVEVVRAPPHDVTINTAVSITGNVIVSRFIAPLFYLERNSMVGFQFANWPDVANTADLAVLLVREEWVLGANKTSSYATAARRSTHT
jgi:hypothetical protein